MLMDIISLFNLQHNTGELRKIHISINGLNGFFIGRLYPDFKLKQPFAHRFQKINSFLVQQIRRNFKMKVGYSIVMLL